MYPKDPVILLSVINTKLRDFYPTLDALCIGEDLNKEELIATLKKINYTYSETQNQFV